MNRELHLTPWQIDAADVARTHNLSGDDAIDAVILDWLSRGDTKPFYDWVLSGHRPSQGVLEAVAMMMMRGDPDCDFDPAKTAKPDLAAVMPFGLAIKGWNSGRRGNAWKRTRDARICAEVAKLRDAGMGYEAAISAVHEWLLSIGINVSHQTVRDAYDSGIAGRGR